MIDIRLHEKKGGFDLICRKKPSIAKNQYYCSLTELLDSKSQYCDHYLLDIRDTKSNVFAIRILGETVGCIILEAGTTKISFIQIDLYQISGNNYPETINTELKQFIGEELYLED